MFLYWKPREEVFPNGIMQELGRNKNKSRNLAAIISCITGSLVSTMCLVLAENCIDRLL